MKSSDYVRARRMDVGACEELVHGGANAGRVRMLCFVV